MRAVLKLWLVHNSCGRSANTDRAATKRTMPCLSQHSNQNLTARATQRGHFIVPFS